MKKAADNVPWTIPPDCKLPDSIDDIERGRTPEQRQRQLFNVADDVMARLKRIKEREQATPPAFEPSYFPFRASQFPQPTVGPESVAVTSNSRYSHEIL